MSLPRQILPNATCMITRRCSERRFFLRPDGVVTQAFLYCLGYAAAVCGVRLHAFVAVSNHWHVILTDPHAVLPRFLARVHRLIAVTVNLFRGRWEAMWSAEKPSIQTLETPEDILDKMIYVYTNPVAAGLVKTMDEWEGPKSTPEQFLTRPDRASRPALYFRSKGKMPRSVQVALVRPPGFEHLSNEQYAAMLREGIAAREAEIAEEFASRGRGFLGMDGVLAQDWREAPKSQTPRRKLNPTVSAKDKQTRIHALMRRQIFLLEYREALQRWIDGARRVLFPAGTYLLRVTYRVRCHPPP